MLKRLLMAGALSLMAVSGAEAACSFENQSEVKVIAASFEAWKAVTGAMAECGNVTAELDNSFREKQPSAFAANPALYQMGGVANSTFVPLYNAGTIRPLDDLVEKYGQNLKRNQLIKIDGKIWGISFMVNLQHMMIRDDILADLGIATPTTYEEVLAAAEKIKAAGVVDYPLGGTMKVGWNLAQDFVNMHIGHGGSFVDGDNMPTINTPEGVAALTMMKRLSEYMDPEFLTSDSTFVQQQFQTGKIAMANLWASRAGAMDDEAESQVVGKVGMHAAPIGPTGIPATTVWWDGFVLAKNISDEDAENTFRVAMEGIDTEMANANSSAAVWLIDGWKPGKTAMGAAASAGAGAKPYPAGVAMGLMHTALGNNLSDFLTGQESAEKALADAEAAYLVAAKEAGLIK